MQDLIIRLDEQRDMLQLLVPQKAGKVGELRVFYEIADSEISSTKNLESHIGETVLAFLSATYAAKSFRLDQYRQAGKDFGRFISNEAAELLGSRDADNEFEGAMLRLNQFDETWSPEDVDEITALLARAAENGSEKAVQFLRDDWPTRSKILKKRLGRTIGN
jgi:hypothetical protein